MDIVVRDEGLEKVTLNALAGPLSGSVVVEGAAPGSQTAPMRVELFSAGYYKVSPGIAVKPDGTFAIPTVAAGSYIVNVTGLPRDYYVKSARLGSRDVLNQTLDWAGLDNGSLEISISPKAPVFEGAVTDADGKPVSGTVTLVPEPPRPGQARLSPSSGEEKAVACQSKSRE